MDIRRMSGKGFRFLCAAIILGMPLPALAEGTGNAIVSNEKSSTLTVLDPSGKVIKSVDSCARPRGMKFNPAKTQIYVGCADDNIIGVYDVKTFALLKRYRNISSPETFDLHPDGRHLYISNEDDSAASVLDVQTGEIVSQFTTGPEPEGVLVTQDGRFVFIASEVSNLVHVIDTVEKKIVKDIPVGTRPRRFALSKDQKELWVSAELAGQVDIIDVETLAPKGAIVFEIKAIRREMITPVDLVFTKDGSRAYVALGRANYVAVVDIKTRKVLDLILVGKRPWGLQLNGDESRLWVANGLSDDVSIIDTKSNKVLVSTPVGEIPYAILIDD